jgi:hypothetical protein
MQLNTLVLPHLWPPPRQRSESAATVPGGRERNMLVETLSRPSSRLTSLLEPPRRRTSSAFLAPSPLSPIARATIHPTANRLRLPGRTRASALDLSSPRPLPSPPQRGGPAEDAPRNGSMEPLTKEASLPRSMASSTSAPLPKLPTPGVDIRTTSPATHITGLRCGLSWDLAMEPLRLRVHLCSSCLRMPVAALTSMIPPPLMKRMTLS